MTPRNQTENRFMRWGIGVVATLMLVAGALLYFQAGGTNLFYSAMLVRVGALLGVICLAFDQLLALKSRLPTVLVVLGLICLLVTAARPNQAKVMIPLLGLVLIGSMVLKWLSGTRGQKK